MTKGIVISSAERKRRSRAMKPKEYHDREREASRRRIKIKRAKDRAQAKVRRHRERLSGSERKEVEALAHNAKLCLLRDWFYSRNLEFYSGIINEEKKLHRLMKKVELNRIEAQIAEFEIAVIEERVGSVGSNNAGLLNGLGTEGGGDWPPKESPMINSPIVVPQVFCGLCDDKYQGLPHYEVDPPSEEDKAYQSSTTYEVNVRFEEDKARLGDPKRAGSGDSNNEGLLHGLGLEGGGDRPSKEIPVITPSIVAPQVFCGLCNDEYQGPPRYEFDPPSKEDESYQSSNNYEVNVRFEENKARLADSGMTRKQVSEDCGAERHFATSDAGEDFGARASGTAGVWASEGVGVYGVAAAKSDDDRSRTDEQCAKVDSALVFCTECPDDGSSQEDDRGVGVESEPIFEAENVDGLSSECFIADLFPWT